MRKTCGQAYFNLGGGYADLLVAVILRDLEVATARSPVGQHRLAAWPTKF